MMTGIDLVLVGFVGGITCFFLMSRWMFKEREVLSNAISCMNDRVERLEKELSMETPDNQP